MLSRLLVRGFSTASPIQEVVVIGAGQMGAGIAQISAQTSHKVTLVDNNPDVLHSCQAKIHANINRVAKKMFKNDKTASEAYTADAVANLSVQSSESQSALATADLVVEAVTEKLDVKQKIFRELDAVCPAKTILASNTSTLKIADIMQEVGRQDRTGGLHFFNPVPVMKLLEVVRTSHTSDQTFDAMCAWGRAIGKHTVACGDHPGFIVNRLLGPYIQEAIAIVEQGHASFQDVDMAMKLGAGYPMGPFQLLDYVGLDLHKTISDNHGRPSVLINNLVEQGKLGVKSGEGFYKYTDDK